MGKGKVKETTEECASRKTQHPKRTGQIAGVEMEYLRNSPLKAPIQTKMSIVASQGRGAASLIARQDEATARNQELLRSWQLCCRRRRAGGRIGKEFEEKRIKVLERQIERKGGSIKPLQADCPTSVHLQ